MRRATLLAAILLALMSVAHLLRLLFRVEATVGGQSVPMWVSVVAALVAGGVAVLLWRDRGAS